MLSVEGLTARRGARTILDSITFDVRPGEVLGVIGPGRTLVLSIHQLSDAARVCDRLLLLNAGRVVAEIFLALASSLTKRLSIQLAVRNVANAHYATFGTYGDARHVLGSSFDDPRFVAPGEPRTVQLSLSFRR